MPNCCHGTSRSRSYRKPALYPRSLISTRSAPPAGGGSDVGRRKMAVVSRPTDLKIHITIASSHMAVMTKPTAATSVQSSGGNTSPCGITKIAWWTVHCVHRAFSPINAYQKPDRGFSQRSTRTGSGQSSYTRIQALMTARLSMVGAQILSAGPLSVTVSTSRWTPFGKPDPAHHAQHRPSRGRV